MDIPEAEHRQLTVLKMALEQPSSNPCCVVQLLQREGGKSADVAC